MTKKNAADLISSSATRYPNQLTGLITYASHQDQHDDEADSYLNHLDLTAISTDDDKPTVVDYASRLIAPAAHHCLDCLAWTDLTGNVTVAVSAVKYLIAPASNLTVTLAAAPTNGDKVQVKVVDLGGYTVTIDGNGNNLDSVATMSLSSGDSLTFEYNSTLALWIVT